MVLAASAGAERWQPTRAVREAVARAIASRRFFMARSLEAADGIGFRNNARMPGRRSPLVGTHPHPARGPHARGNRYCRGNTVQDSPAAGHGAKTALDEHDAVLPPHHRAQRVRKACRDERRDRSVRSIPTPVSGTRIRAGCGVREARTTVTCAASISPCDAGKPSCIRARFAARSSPGRVDAVGHPCNPGRPHACCLRMCLRLQSVPSLRAGLGPYAQRRASALDESTLRAVGDEAEHQRTIDRGASSPRRHRGPWYAASRPRADPAASCAAAGLDHHGCMEARVWARRQGWRAWNSCDGDQCQPIVVGRAHARR